MTNPVAPVEGHYAMLRDGDVARPEVHRNGSAECLIIDVVWSANGKARNAFTLVDDPDYDIIAIITPEAMQAAASGEVERLRAALKEIVKADDNYKADSNFMKDSFSDGYSDGLHDAAYVARAALKEEAP